MFDRKTCWDRHVHGSAAAAAPSGVAAAEGFPRSFCLPFLQKDVKEGLLASSLMASVIGSLPGRIYNLSTAPSGFGPGEHSPVPA